MPDNPVATDIPDLDFDRVFDRVPSASTKWNKYAQDVLPFWVADMDFATPGFVLRCGA